MGGAATTAQRQPSGAGGRDEPLDPRFPLETTSDSVCVVDRDWSITYLNERALADVRRSDDVVGSNLWRTFPDLLGTEFEKAYRRAMEERVSTRAEDYYKPSDAWFRSYAHPLPDGMVIYFRDVTVKRWRQAALLENEERFRKLFESLTQGVVLHDADGTVIHANPAAERIVGFSLAQLRNIHQHDSGDAVDENGAPLPREKRPAIVALTTGRPVENFVMGVMHPKLGERRWLNVHAVPIFDEGAVAPSKVYALFADVTLRKRAEMALSASEARLNRITANLPIAVFERLLTADGKITYPYFKARELACPESGDLAPGDDGSLWAQVHPEDRKPYAERMRASAKDLSVLSQAFRLIEKDGSVRWMQSSGAPRRLENGDTLWEGFAIDVTEQKRTEEALRASEAKARRSEAHFARAQRVARIGSSEVDFRSGEWIWSDELYRMYGLDKESFPVSKEALREKVHPDDRAAYDADIERATRGEAVGPLEFRILRPDGEVRTIYREVEITRDADGWAIGAVATKQDITELRRAEREREQFRRELFHAQRMDALGRLAGGIAHDINNTLVPVIGLTESVLKNLPAGSPDAEALAIVRDAGARAKALVKQILTFSRGEAPDRRPVDLKLALFDTVQFIRATVPATIEIETRFEPVASVLADVAQLGQVIINLITNAVDAIGAAKGKIIVALAPGGSGIVGAGSCVRLSVGDTGCGMDAQTKHRVFEPFFTTKEVDKGTGLGLAVVYGIVCGHGGRIEVMSEPDKGTRFDIFLPTQGPECEQGE